MAVRPVLIPILLAVLFALGGWLAGALTALERPGADLWHRLGAPPAEPAPVTLVKLDEATLARHPDEPLAFWAPHFARALANARQAGARVVGIDFLFSISAELWLSRLGQGLEAERPGSGAALQEAARHYDQSFRQQLAKGQMVLAAIQSAQDPVLPVQDYLLALPDFDLLSHLGAVNLLPDDDGVIRRLQLLPPGAADLPLRSFAPLVAVRATGQDPAAPVWRFQDRIVPLQAELPVSWLGPPGTLPSLSMTALLADDALSRPEVQALKDQVVVIGATYSGNGDLHPTPFSRGPWASGPMAGVEIQGQMVAALLLGRFLDPVPHAVVVGAILVAALAGGMIARRLSWGGGGVAVMAGIVLLWAGGYLAFRLGWLVPVVPAQVAFLLALAGTFGWRFSHGERERQRLRRMFARYVGPELVEALMASPQPPALGGTMRQVSVLFSDIRGFTSISEKLAPAEVVEMLNAYFERACAIMIAEGGCIDKFIGDAIMVEFGAPLDQPDHAERALRSALALRQAALSFQNWMVRRFPDRDLPPFDVGIGVHSGAAIIGNIGAPARMEYTAIGDTVNLASRLEGMTKTLGCAILVSQETIRTSPRAFRLGRDWTITVKGRAAPVQVWEVLGSKED